MPAMTFFITTPRGLEQVLVEELQKLGITIDTQVDGGVRVQGNWADCYRINLHSRVAGKVLWQVGQGRFRNEDDVYRQALQLPWQEWFDVECSIKIRHSAKNTQLKSPRFVVLKLKDAVCDSFRRQGGARPSVDMDDPDIQIQIFMEGDQYWLYLDTSGEALFKRGWRSERVTAPIRENLAAGILRLCGWEPDMPLFDPMCGGGTFLIEAAWMALNRAPGLNRRFAFERLRSFDVQTWRQLQESARSAELKPAMLPILGRDKDTRALAAARTHLRNAGVERLVQVEKGEFLNALPPLAKGLLLVNPPYGERLEDRETLQRFYPRFGATLKQQYAGWQVGIITADLGLPKALRLKPRRKIPLFNGALESRLYLFDMVAGSMRKTATVEQD